MNTLQLDRALSRNPVTKKSFLGVFPSDQLPIYISKFPCCFIVNTESSDSEGLHWLAIYIPSSRKMEFFDSYGNPPSFFKGPIADFAVQFSKMDYNPMTLQSNTTAVCGQYCIYFLFSRCRGIPLKTIISSFVTNHLSNDIRVYNFVSKYFRVHANFYQ